MSVRHRQYLLFVRGWQAGSAREPRDPLLEQEAAYDVGFEEGFRQAPVLVEAFRAYVKRSEQAQRAVSRREVLSETPPVVIIEEFTENACSLPKKSPKIMVACPQCNRVFFVCVPVEAHVLCPGCGQLHPREVYRQCTVTD